MHTSIPRLDFDYSEIGHPPINAEDFANDAVGLLFALDIVIKESVAKTIQKAMLEILGGRVGRVEWLRKWPNQVVTVCTEALLTMSVEETLRSSAEGEAPGEMARLYEQKSSEISELWT